MTTTASDKEDVFSSILEKAKVDVEKAMQDRTFRLKETPGYSDSVESIVQVEEDKKKARENWRQ